MTTPNYASKERNFMVEAFRGLFGASESNKSDEPGEASEPREPDTRVIGKIIKVSSEGWGFISTKEIKFTRIFFHWTSLKQGTLNFTELRNGMQVEFTPIEVEGKGYRAIRIVILEEDEPSDSD